MNYNSSGVMIKAFHGVTYVTVLGALCAVVLLVLLAAFIIYKVFRHHNMHRKNNSVSPVHLPVQSNRHHTGTIIHY